MNRREFIKSTFYSSLLYGAGGLPNLVNESQASFEPLGNRILVNTFLNGGPDMRHIVVPAFDNDVNSVGYQYWAHRWRAHDIENNANAWQTRFNEDYFPITVGGDNWGQGGANLVDLGGKNSGFTFGIWKEAGWLIDMFVNGNAAFVFNAAGGRNRAHDLAALQLNQGNLLSQLSDLSRSGWGGRLARSAGRNLISVTNTPTRFCFGPLGAAPNYDPNSLNNDDLVSIARSREIGLNSLNLERFQTYQADQKLARSVSSYYAAIRAERNLRSFEKFLDHEQVIRVFGDLIEERLLSVEQPLLMQALMNPISINGQPVNPAPGSNQARPILRNRYNFGFQVQNLYDVLAINDALNPGVISMEYNDWDSHENQRANPNTPDPNNPDLPRGIEGHFRDLFGGPYSEDPNALYGAFSALLEAMRQQGNTNSNRLVFTFAGEFGRQLRDNGGGGTDHGTGNLLLVIGEQVRGGLYGEMFPDTELPRYALSEQYTPDIEARTDIDFLFSAVSNWVVPNSARSVFPRLTQSGLPLDQRPVLEDGVVFTNLFT